MGEERLHVAQIAGEFVHGDGGSAAQVVRRPMLCDSEFGLGVADELAQVLRGLGLLEGWEECLTVARFPELPDERARVVEVALFEQTQNVLSDGERSTCAVLCGEFKHSGCPVVVGGRESRGGARADGEVAAQQEPQPRVFGQRGEEAVEFGAVNGDVAWRDGRIASNLRVEFRCAVILPQPPEEAAERGGYLRFR